MQRDEIYDHLAQVYLGKRSKKAEEKNKKELSAWLLINIFITLIIFTSAFYGLTAFLTQKSSFLKKNIIFSLHNGPVTLAYNFRQSFTPVKELSLSIPPIDPSKYHHLHFSVRAKEEGSPGVVKVVLRNRKEEIAFYYVEGITLDWQDVDIPLEKFQYITDWTSLKDISFVLESWNVNKPQGLILIDEICFSS